MTLADITQSIEAYIPKLLAALPVAVAVILGSIMVNLIAGRVLTLLARRTDLTELDLTPARNVLRWLIRIITVVLVLGVFGFELGGLWAMISTVLAMVAIGFVAVWSLLSHTSATVLLVILRPFHVGDDIELPSESVAGRVIDLNFFFTTLLDHEGKEWRVPNNLFFQKVVKRSRNHHRLSLAHQLNSPDPARMDPPPPPKEEPEKRKVTPASEDFAAKAVPDPATISPRR